MPSKLTRRSPIKPKPARVPQPPLVELQTGQIWKAGETYVHIKQAGARLIHYKMAKALHQPGLRRHLSSVKTVRAYLKSQGAELLTELGSTAADP